MQLELLGQAGALLQRGWTRLADARDRRGRPVEPCSDAAVEWSLLGALVAAFERAAAGCEATACWHLVAACAALAEVIDDDSLEAWNDAPERTQRDVLEALAAAACGPDGSYRLANEYRYLIARA